MRIDQRLVGDPGDAPLGGRRNDCAPVPYGDGAPRDHHVRMVDARQPDIARKIGGGGPETDNVGDGHHGDKLLHAVATHVNTTRSNLSATVCDMTTPGKRLEQARLAAGFSSSRAAAMNFGWPVSTYNSHERSGEPGGREYKARAATQYAVAFGVSSSWLLFGQGIGPAKTPAKTDGPALPVPKSNVSQPLAPPVFSEDRIPVLGVARGGDDGRFEFNGETVEYVPRPPNLIGVRRAYAIYVTGDSMLPRYRPGEMLWVNPHKPPEKYDDVVVQLHPASSSEPPEGLVKEFRAWTPSRLMLWQYNPAGEVEIERRLVKDVHLVVGSMRA